LDARQLKKLTLDEEAGPVEILVEVRTGANMRVRRDGLSARPLLVKHADFPRKILV